MAGSERKISFFTNPTTDKGFRITNPSAYKSEQLQSIVAAQMLEGGWEIIIKADKKKAILVPEKTLQEAINLPIDSLKSFLEKMTDAMQDSREIIIQKVPRFSNN